MNFPNPSSPPTNQQNTPEKTIYDLAQERKLSFKEYFDLITRSVKEPVIDGVVMPGFPDMYTQAGFVGRAGEDALDEAFRFYRVLREYCAETGNPVYQDIPVLDFGCGWGRMSRMFFRTISSKNFWGVDVDPNIIDFCAANLRHGNYKTIQPNPPIDFETNTFQVVFAYSVFSHLAEPTALNWIKEIARILKPGGVLVATTQGRGFLDFCESKQGKTHEKSWHNMLAESFLPINQSKEDYDNGKFLFDSHMRRDDDVRQSSYYGEALIPLQYIQEHYTPYLHLIDFVKEYTFFEKAQTKLSQALFVMRKPE